MWEKRGPDNVALLFLFPVVEHEYLMSKSGDYNPTQTAGNRTVDTATAGRSSLTLLLFVNTEQTYIEHVEYGLAR